MGIGSAGTRVEMTPAAPSAGVDVDLAGASLPNTRGRTWQDRWSVGRHHRGAWLVLADGIGGGEHGDRAAQAAVHVTAGHLLTGELDEVAVMTAFGLAQAAVSPWYRRSGGGCTLSIVTVTPGRVVAASLGDSPVLVARDGVWHQVSPMLSGPLRTWVGSPESPRPWLDSWPADDVPAVLVCSDGVAAHATPVDDGDPRTWVHGLVSGYRTPDGDDATAVAAVLRGSS